MVEPAFPGRMSGELGNDLGGVFRGQRQIPALIFGQETAIIP
jgi:hypothetical protein